VETKTAAKAPRLLPNLTGTPAALEVAAAELVVAEPVVEPEGVVEDAETVTPNPEEVPLTVVGLVTVEETEPEGFVLEELAELTVVEERGGTEEALGFWATEKAAVSE